MQVWSLGQEDPLEEGMATHSSIPAQRIPWTEEPERLQSTGLQRAGHKWSHLVHTQVIWTPLVNQKRSGSKVGIFFLLIRWFGYLTNSEDPIIAMHLYILYFNVNNWLTWKRIWEGLGTVLCTFSSMLASTHQMIVSTLQLPSCDNQHCVQTFLNDPWGENYLQLRVTNWAC